MLVLTDGIEPSIPGPQPSVLPLALRQHVIVFVLSREQFVQEDLKALRVLQP